MKRFAAVLLAVLFVFSAPFSRMQSYAIDEKPASVQEGITDGGYSSAEGSSQTEETAVESTSQTDDPGAGDTNVPGTEKTAGTEGISGAGDTSGTGDTFGEGGDSGKENGSGTGSTSGEGTVPGGNPSAENDGNADADVTGGNEETVTEEDEENELTDALDAGVEMITEEATFEEHVIEDADLPDPDQLFAGYVQSVMYEGIEEKIPETEEDLISMPALNSLVPQREGLSANEKKLYDLLKTEVTKVANGERADASFSFSPALIVGKTTFTAAELGLADCSNGDAVGAALHTLFGDFKKVVRALMTDCPYELYWFDKTKGWSSAMSDEGWSYGGYSATLLGNTLIEMHVAKAYSQADAVGTMDVDTVKTGAAKTARTNAEAIVTRHASKTDYGKLTAYRDEICAAVEYNHGALASGTPYGDPWQLIYVFDNDPATDVVCEGYSKAFQLLYDLSEFQSNLTNCITVSGMMGGGTGAGGHMWNVLTMEDGENYIADVTNSDAGTRGNFRLFLRGAPQGSAEAYTIGTVSYTYYDGTKPGHDNVLEMYPASQRELSKNDYYSDVLTDPAYLYPLDVLPPSVMFDDVVFASGYESQSKQIRIINRGTDTLKNLTVFILGEDAGAFELDEAYLSGNYLDDLPVNYATQFSVSTRQYLDKKTYHATAVIYTNSTPIATIPLSFTVKSNVSPDTKYDLRFIGTINDLDNRNTFKMAAIPESDFKFFHIVFEDRQDSPQGYDVVNRKDLADRFGLSEAQAKAMFSTDCVKYEVLKKKGSNYVPVTDEESPLILQKSTNPDEELGIDIKKKETRSDGPFYFRVTFSDKNRIYDGKNVLLYELENDPTVYCDTKEEAYAAIREIIRNRTNNMGRYKARNYRNYDTNGYVYERIYVNEDAFKTASGTATAISMEDVCDFSEEREGMAPYEGDYMFNLIGNRVKEAFTYEAPSVFGENDESMGISTEYDPVTDTYSTYGVFEVYLPVITTLAEEQAVDARVQSLLNNEFASVKNSASNTEKINAIYNYIKSHVSGTVSGGGGSNRKWPQYHTAYHALIKGNGTCESFAQLFTRLSREMGVASKVIMGVDASAHTYNIVDGGDGYWYFIDCSAGIGLSASGSFPRAQEQERYTRTRYIVNYWNKVKGGTDYHAETIKVLDQSGTVVHESLDEDEVTGYLLNQLGADPAAVFTIRFDSDWMLDLYQGYRFAENASRVSIDLSGNTLRCRNHTVFGVKEIRNGTIQVGYQDPIHLYSGSVMFEGDIRLENVSFTKGTVNPFVVFDLNEFYGSPEIILDNVTFNNVYVNMIHQELLASDPMYGPSFATYRVTIDSTVTFNGSYFNLMSHSEAEHPVIHLNKSSSPMAKLVFNGTNTIGSVMWPKGASASLSYDVCKPIEFVPVSGGTETVFEHGDVIATNNGTLRRITSKSGATGTTTPAGITDEPETIRHKRAEETKLSLQMSGRDYLCSRPTIQVTFDANGGTFSNAADSKKNVTADDRYGVLPVPIRTGYAFMGWYTARTGGAVVNAETTMTNDAAHTLYARWEVNSYTVTYDANGGSITQDANGNEVPNLPNVEKSIEYGRAYDTLPVVTRTGHTFVGWFTQETGGTQVTAKTVLKTDADHTLYARWKVNTYQVQFDANGGKLKKSTEAKRNVAFDSVYGTLPEVTREGYDFVGWFPAASGSATEDEVTEATVVETPATHTLYAYWNIQKYTVSLNVQGGTITPPQDSLEVTFGDKYEELPEPDEWDGYLFLGWYTSAIGGTEVKNSTDLVVNEDHTLYAVWKRIYPVAAPTAVVTYNGEARDGSNPVEPGSKVSLFSETNGVEIYYKVFSGSVSDADKNDFVAQVNAVREKNKNGTELSDEDKKLRFEDAIIISSDVTLLAMAVKDDHADSVVQVFRYTIKDMSDEWGEVSDEDKAATDNNNNPLFSDANALPDGLWVMGLVNPDYDGTAKTQPNMRVYHGKKLLTAGTDYTVKYANNKNAGTAKVTVTGKGAYAGTIVEEFTIKPLSIADAKTAMDDLVDSNENVNAHITLAWNGKVQKGKTTLTYELNGKTVTLKEGTDYTLVWKGTTAKINSESAAEDIEKYGESNANAFKMPGIWEIVVHGKGNYSETRKILLEIANTDPENTGVYGDKKTVVTALTIPALPNQTYAYRKDNSGGRAFVYMPAGNSLNHTPNADTEQALQVTDKTGTKDFTWNITDKNKIDTNGKKYTYSLKYGEDYLLDCYEANDCIGTASVTIIGTGDYTGTKTVTFKITGRAMSAVKIKDFKSSIAWTGSESRQDTAILYYQKVDNALVEGTDYEVVYDNNTDIGTATVVYTGKGLYTGTLKKTYKITGTPMSKVTIPFDVTKMQGYDKSLKGFVYTGLPYELAGPDSRSTEEGVDPTMPGQVALTFDINKTPKDKEDDVKLEKGTDYTVTYLNNDKTGTAKVSFTGKGKYYGTIDKTFTIKAYSLASDAKESEPRVKVYWEADGSTEWTADGENNSSYTYVKGGVKPEPVVKYSYTDPETSRNVERVLTKGTDYTLTYKNNNQVKPDANGSKDPTVTITGKGALTGSISRTFTITERLFTTEGAEPLSITATDVVYQNKPGICKPAITITDTNGAKLAAGTDYEKNIEYTYVYDTVVDVKVGKTIEKELRHGETAESTPGTGDAKAGADVKSTDIIPAGTIIRVTVTGKGNYSSKITREGVTTATTISTTFRYIAGNVSKASVSVKAQNYEGVPVEPTKADITVKIGKTALAKTDYEITGYTNNLAKKTGTVTIRGIGNYSGTKTVSFKINAKSMNYTICYDNRTSLKERFGMDEARFQRRFKATGSMANSVFAKGSNLRKNTFKIYDMVLGVYLSFDGWNTEPDGSGISYGDNIKFYYDNDSDNRIDYGSRYTLYAQWKIEDEDSDDYLRKSRELSKLKKSIDLSWDKIVCYGDSLTAWSGSYADKMGSVLGITTVNKAVGGAHINYDYSESAYESRIRRIVRTTGDEAIGADAVFLMAGTVDWLSKLPEFADRPIGDVSTGKTFKFDFDQICDAIEEKFPDIDKKQIYVVLPPPSAATGNRDLNIFRDAEREVAQERGFTVIDAHIDALSTSSGAINKTYYSDSVHLNALGYDVLAVITAEAALRAIEPTTQPVP